MTAAVPESASRGRPQLLCWPWSLADPDRTSDLQTGRASLRFAGCALAACPPGAGLLPVGGAADLALHAEPPGLNMYELPQGRSGVSPDELELQLSDGATRERWRIDLEGARTRFVPSADGEEQYSPESNAVVDWWEAFDDLRKLREAPDDSIPWHRVEDWLSEQKGSSEPRRALIVEIAERLGTSLAQRTQHLRRILLRRRDVVPVHRIAQLDEECLRWYIRQPGVTLAEKAGHRQEILAVVRQETFDTLENRVLKDFLRRCVRAAARYVRQFKQDYPNSERVLRVARLARSCGDALQQPELESVSRPRPGVQPNYVLQNDARYREIWHWYQRLLRNQDSEEHVWNWQSRLWADVCRLLLATGCRIALAPAGSQNAIEWPVVDASFVVGNQGRLGRRLVGSWPPGPLALRERSGETRAAISIVDAEQALAHPLVAPFVAAGGHAYVVREPLSGVGERADVLVVWAINAMATTARRDPADIRRSASSALENLISRHARPLERSVRRLDGLILTSQLGHETHLVSDAPAHGPESSAVSVGVLQVSTDPQGWADGAVEVAVWIERWLR